MRRYFKTIFPIFALLTCALWPEADAAAEQRFALVIGNASYRAKPLATAVNDAALVAQTLNSAGFNVIGARDLDQVLLRKAIREFADRVASAGPGAIALVYFSGYGLQLAGENFLIPIGADISDAMDLRDRALSLSELKRAIAALNPTSSFIVVDAARPGPYVLPGQAGGFAWSEPESNMLIALSSAPGILARDVAGEFGPYARAIAEMIREGDLTPASLFDRVRLRVHETTRGAQIPWYTSRIETSFKFFERAPGAPVRTDAPSRTAQLRLQPMRLLAPEDAYMVALLRDTFDGYADFLADYWQDPMTKRVRALLAARRESLTWQRTCQANEPAAYWSYLERYPHGPHVTEASRLLTQMGAGAAPPPRFARMDYDIPPPLPDELDYVERPALILDDPVFRFESPPPTPANFLEPTPQELLNLRPAASATAPHALPVAAALPLPSFLRLPAAAIASAPPSGNAREALGIRPSIDLPAGPERQPVASSILSPQVLRDANKVAGGVQPGSPVGEEARPIKSPIPSDATDGASVASSTSRSSALAPVIIASPSTPDLNAAGPAEARSLNQKAPDRNASMPIWLTDTLTARNRAVSAHLRAFEDEGLMSTPSMFQPASAGLAYQTWGRRAPSSRRAPQPPGQVLRLVAPGRPRDGLSGQPSPPAMPVPQTTATISPSAGRAATPSPAALGNRKPSTNVIAPLTISADQANQRKKPAATKPAPSNEAANSSSGAPQPPPANTH